MFTVSSERWSKDAWRDRLFFPPYFFPTLIDIIVSSVSFHNSVFSYRNMSEYQRSVCFIDVCFYKNAPH